jgi:hypothetical protein
MSKQAKQTQWGITILIGILFILGGAGTVEVGRQHGFESTLVGVILSIWGLYKTWIWDVIE